MGVRFPLGAQSEASAARKRMCGQKYGTRLCFVRALPVTKQEVPLWYGTVRGNRTAGVMFRVKRGTDEARRVALVR
jgi:hypothetical protein